MNKHLTYLNNLNGKCLTGLLEFIINPDNKHLHTIRVNIKKVRSLFRLLKHADTTFHYKKHYNRYRPLFVAAGKIRNHEIYLELLGRKQVYTKLSATITGEVEHFKKQSVQYVFMLEEAKRIDSKAVKSLKQKDVDKYFKHCYKKVMKQGSAPIPVIMLHDFRKQVKELLYTAGLMKKPPVDNWGELQPVLDKLQDQIGLWHDKKLLTQYLQRQKMLAEQERSKIEKLKREMIIRREKIEVLRAEFSGLVME